MSLTFINDFQKKLYSIIAKHKELGKSLNKIYLGVAKDGKPPFLSINILRVEDLSRHSSAIYSVDFQILAYVKDDNQGQLTKMAAQISEAFAEEKTKLFDKYIIAGMRAGNMTFETAKDLVLGKLAIEYKALIKREIYD